MLKFIRALKTRRYVRRSQTEVQGYQQVSADPVSSGPSKRAQEMIEQAKRLAEQQESEHD